MPAGTEVGGRPDAAASPLPKTLVVTGHYPPVPGGVARFTAELVRRLPADRIVVLAPDVPGAASWDESSSVPILRYRGHPTTNPLLVRRVAQVIREHNCEVVWLTSGLPLGLLAGAARRAGARRVVVSTHGLEAGWADLPVIGRLLGHCWKAAEEMSVLGDATAPAISRRVGPGTRVFRLTGGVETQRFRPDAAAASRTAYGMDRGPVVITVGRLVPRKGQDTLIRSWPMVLAQHPSAHAILVGDGYAHGRLLHLAQRLGVASHIKFAGPVPDADLPGLLAAADIYTLPCRTRLRGMLLEGLGLTTLEASAAGLPVIVGDSGGAADAVLPGVSGEVIHAAGAAAPERLATAINRLLADPALRASYGDKGRSWVEEQWSWQAMAQRLAAALAGDATMPRR